MYCYCIFIEKIRICRNNRKPRALGRKSRFTEPFFPQKWKDPSPTSQTKLENITKKARTKYLQSCLLFYVLSSGSHLMQRYLALKMQRILTPSVPELNLLEVFFCTLITTLFLKQFKNSPYTPPFSRLFDGYSGAFRPKFQEDGSNYPPLPAWQNFITQNPLYLFI